MVWYCCNANSGLYKIPDSVTNYTGPEPDKTALIEEFEQNKEVVFARKADLYMTAAIIVPIITLTLMILSSALIAGATTDVGIRSATIVPLNVVCGILGIAAVHCFSKKSLENSKLHGEKQLQVYTTISEKAFKLQLAIDDKLRQEKLEADLKRDKAEFEKELQTVTDS